MKNNPNSFEQYLSRQKADPEFLKRFEKAGEAWEVALQISRLREATGLSQSELAGRLGTSQQQISRLESPSCEGHSLSMLRRVASALGAKLKIRFEPVGETSPAHAETFPSTAAESPAHKAQKGPPTPPGQRQGPKWHHQKTHPRQSYDEGEFLELEEDKTLEQRQRIGQNKLD